MGCAGIGRRPSSATSAPALPIVEWVKAEEAGDGSGLRNKIVAALEAAYEQKEASVGPAGDALHRKGSDAAHPRSALARASRGDGLHAPGHFPAQLRAEESEAGIQARGVRTVLRHAGSDQVRYRDDGVEDPSAQPGRDRARGTRAPAAPRARAAAAACRGGFADSGGIGHSRAPAAGSGAAEEGQRPRAPARRAPFVRAVPKVGRNEPCPCGSGSKYKHCHGALQQASG